MTPLSFLVIYLVSWLLAAGVHLLSPPEERVDLGSFEGFTIFVAFFILWSHLVTTLYYILVEQKIQ